MPLVRLPQTFCELNKPVGGGSAQSFGRRAPLLRQVRRQLTPLSSSQYVLTTAPPHEGLRLSVQVEQILQAGPQPTGAHKSPYEYQVHDYTPLTKLSN
jgi:hypothetical protein